MVWFVISSIRDLRVRAGGVQVSRRKKGGIIAMRCSVESFDTSRRFMDCDKPDAETNISLQQLAKQELQFPHTPDVTVNKPDLNLCRHDVLVKPQARDNDTSSAPPSDLYCA